MQASLDYRTNRDLFSNHYLDEHLPETDEWDAVGDREVRAAYDELRRLYREQADLVAEYNERQLRQNLLNPVFDVLGLTTAVEEPVSGERLRPDYTLFGDERTRDDAFRRRADGGDFHRDALAVADAKRWGRSLDGAGERDFTNPSYQIHVYLDATGLDRGILTNGRRWRLYYGPTSHRLDSYYEIDLPTLLETGDPEEFKYFYLFFRREAFLGGDQPTPAGRTGHARTDAPFVDRVHERSNRFAEELSEDLRENVYEALGLLAQGFVDGADDLDEDDLDRVYEASLTYLYRLIFVLYAESDGRDLLDTDNEVYRRRYSLNALKHRVAEELDSPDPIYRKWQTALWDRLDELFELVDRGSEAKGIPEDDLYVPAYNGGLFESDETRGETAAFLDTHTVGDAYLAQVIELLTRRERDGFGGGGDAGGGGGGVSGSGERGGSDRDRRAFVDYSSLDVRHLGSIYEGLLEYDLELADEPLVAVDDGGEQRWSRADEADPDAEVVERVEPGEVYLTTDTGRRKATGSYYTPEPVVEHVVENTLEPLVAEIRDELDPEDADYAEAFAQRVFGLDVLDPAMGSGHFLIKAVEYLARAVVEAHREQAERAGPETVPDGRDVHWARRRVAQRCIYGVDSNALAVELAKVSLWLRTLAAEQPLAFLDHHLKQGDSLAGTDVAAVEERAADTGPNASLADFGATRADAFGDLLDAYREFVTIENESLADVKEMERKYGEIRRDDLRTRLTEMANVHAAERFGLDVPSGAYERMGRAVDDDRGWADLREAEWFREAQRIADERDFLHWELAFPEVFYDGAGEREAEAGFDAVVGNPPYVRSRNLPEDLKAFYREEYRTAEGAYDLYVPFAELAADLGVRVSLVVPNKWTTTGYGRALRDLLLDERRLRSILDASDLRVFPDADIYPVVVTYERGSPPDDHAVRIRKPDDLHDLSDAPTASLPVSFVDRLGGRVIPLDADPAFLDVAADVLADCDRLGDHATMSEAIHTGNVRGKLLVEPGADPESDERIERIVDGESVDRYRLDWDGTRIRYDESLVERREGEYADLRDPDLFEGEKLFVRDISDRPVAVHDDERYYALNTLYSVRPREDSDLSLRYLLGVFNSAFVARYFRQIYGGTNVRGEYLRFKPMFAERIPVPDPERADVDSEEVRGIAERAGVENPPSDPEAAVAALTERLRAVNDERSTLNLDVLDHLGGYAAGPTLADLGTPTEGVGDTILAETARDRDGLRIGGVRVERDGDALVLSATARYKPGDGERDDRDTDRWGYVETDPVPAVRFPGLATPSGEREIAERTLVEAFVPVAVERGGGFAEFRESATQTNSLLDRLRALTLPDPDDVTEELARFRNARERAAELDDRAAALDGAIDRLVYRLYGLDEEGIAAVVGDRSGEKR